MDYKAYSADKHFQDIRYLAKGWVREWGTIPADQITQQQIKDYVFKRGGVNVLDGAVKVKHPNTANKEIKFLRALFNWGKNQNPAFVLNNPAAGIPYFPVDKFIKYVPPTEDVVKVLWAASQEDREYLYAIWDTKGRMGEINKLIWEDIYLDQGPVEPWKKSYLIVYTKKKKGGSRTPRKIPLTKRLYEILLKRFKVRDKHIPWVFWHRYWSRKAKSFIEGPYIERSKLMKTLCKKAGVKYFRYHALRHSGASIMADNPNTTIGSIQRILGHESQRTTERYLHSINEAEREAIEAFEKDSEIEFYPKYIDKKREK